MRYLLRVEIDCSETFHARSVDNIAVAVGQRIHFGERSGVHARMVNRRNAGRLHFESGNQTVDERRLAHAGIAGKQGHLFRQH